MVEENSRYSQEPGALWLRFSIETAAVGGNLVRGGMAALDLIVQRLRDLPLFWEGRSSIERMMAENYNWRQSEWPGFFFQLLCRELLDGLMEIPGRKYDTGDFDAFYRNDWDFKTHTSSISGVRKRSSEVILNDLETINQALDKHGLVHFLIASGDAVMDIDGAFKIWHDDLKGAKSDYVKQRIARGAPSRRLKTSFSVQKVEVFEVNLENQGFMKAFSQGRNSNGRPRPMKYSLSLDDFPVEHRTLVVGEN